MRNLFKKILSLLIKGLEVDAVNNSVDPQMWSAFVAALLLKLKGASALITGFLFFIGFLAIGSFTSFDIGSVTKVASVGFIIGAVLGSLRSFSNTTEKSEEDENVVEDADTVVVPQGSKGILLFLGKPYKADLGVHTTDGRFKVNSTVPFFGNLFDVKSQKIYYDNLDIIYVDIATADGEYIRGKISLTFEVVDILTVFAVETSASKEGVMGRAKDKALELLAFSAGDYEVEELLLSGKDAGLNLLHDSLRKYITASTGPNKCFDTPKTLVGGFASRGADCYFKEIGMNIKFTIKTAVPQDEELAKIYSRINQAQAGKLLAKEDAEITRINADAAAVAAEIAGKMAAELTVLQGAADAEVIEEVGKAEANVMLMTGEADREVLYALSQLIEKDPNLKDLPADRKKELITITMNKSEEIVKSYNLNGAAGVAEILTGLVEPFLKK